MAGTVFHAGKDASVTIAGGATPVRATQFTAMLNSFSANFPMQIFDITSFGNSGWRAKLGGLFDANGSCGGYVTSGTTADTLASVASRSQVGAAMTLNFDGAGTATSTCFITFAGVVVSNIKVGADVNSVQTVSFDWENASATAPAVTWVTS